MPLTKNFKQYEYFIEKHSELKKFTEEYERSLYAAIVDRPVGSLIRIKYRKPDLVHSYKSRYRTAEDIKKQNTNSIFLSITSLSLLLYVYIYHKA